MLVAFGRLVKHLDQQKLLAPADTERIQALAAEQAKTLIASNDDSDNNIRLAQMLGSAYLKSFVVDAARCAALEQRLERYWASIARTGDLDEDAQNYDSLGAVFMVELAQELGHEDDLRSRPGFRRLFTRFRDTISPTGLVPEYGDSYFSDAALYLDRVFLLEYAASLYRDATFRWAAALLYRRPLSAPPPPDLWCRGLGLISLPLLEAPPTPPQGDPSTVTYRARPGDSADHVDKLILRTGRSPDDAMVLFDLYASGSHSHPEKGPSLAYYEVGGAPLFHNLGRQRTRSAITGNLPWALPPGERFPGCWNRPGEWHTMTIPVERLATDGEQYRLAPGWSLRNFNELNRGCESLWFDNLRLVGPGGSRIVDGFESVLGWDPRIARLTKIDISSRSTEGAGSTEIAWRPLPSSEFKKTFAQPLAAPFSRNQFTGLKLDMQYSGARPYAHIRGLGQQVDLGDQLLESRLSGAHVEQRGRDAFGRIDHEHYITPDSKLSRRIVLTAEGWLVIHDILTPGAAMRDFRAGQLWQLYTLAGQGGDWFASDDDGAYPCSEGAWPARRMLVRFATDAATTAGVETIDQPYHCPNPKGRPAERFFTTFSRRGLTPGRAERFSLAVAPLVAGRAAPADVAGQIHFDFRADGVSARLPRDATSDAAPGETVTKTEPGVTAKAVQGDIVVEIRGDAWSVRRE